MLPPRLFPPRMFAVQRQRCWNELLKGRHGRNSQSDAKFVAAPVRDHQCSRRDNLCRVSRVRLGDTPYARPKAHHGSGSLSCRHGVLGLLYALVGVGALTAASRFPVIGHMAGPNDFLFFLAVTLAGLGTAALVIMGAFGFAIFPAVVLFAFLSRHSILRKIYRLPEVRTPGEV